MKKGFTLIELVGVILILGIVATIITVTIDSSVKKSRLNSCIAQEKNIIEAVKNYLIDNPNKLPNDDYYSEISLTSLTGTYLDKDLTNPVSDNKYTDTNTKVIVISCNKKSYKYKVCYNVKEESCNTKEEDTCTYVLNHRTETCNE